MNLFGFQHSIIKNCVNLAKYPLTLPGDSAWNDTIDGIRQDLAREGCAILPSFILPEALARLEKDERWVPLVSDGKRPWTDDYTNVIGSMFDK